MRTDKKRNLNKVAKVAIKEPLLTRDEVAKKAGVSQGTASNMLKELDLAGRKDERIVAITNEDIKILKLTQKATKKRLLNQEDESFSDIIRAGAESAKRFTIFRGDITDENGGLKNIDSIEIL